MTTRHMGILVHLSRPEASTVADALAAAAARRGIETHVLDDTPPAHQLDVIVGVGGDGTLLEAARCAHHADIPVAGVNLGTVGYLTEFDPSDLGALLDAVQTEPRRETERMVVEARRGTGERRFGINDVVLEKELSQRIVNIAVAIGGEYFTTYRADGIIVATPLGSTAYSLSVGGPVLDPELEALVLSPVAPHSLLSRSLVVTPTTSIEFTVVGDRPVRVNLDGREAWIIGEGEQVTVTRAERPVRFVTAGGSPFPQPVRRQFGLDHA